MLYLFLYDLHNLLFCFGSYEDLEVVILFVVNTGGEHHLNYVDLNLKFIITPFSKYQLQLCNGFSLLRGLKP